LAVFYDSRNLPAKYAAFGIPLGDCQFSALLSGLSKSGDSAAQRSQDGDFKWFSGCLGWSSRGGAGSEQHTEAYKQGYNKHNSFRHLHSPLEHIFNDIPIYMG
jgi:hypothetical protein